MKVRGKKGTLEGEKFQEKSFYIMENKNTWKKEINRQNRKERA